ncbi:unnamed protein product, partial [Staurois parvus]
MYSCLPFCTVCPAVIDPACPTALSFLSGSYQLYAIGGSHYRSWGFSGSATWSPAASSPSPPSGALVKGSLGLRLRAPRDSGLWVVVVVSRCVTLPLGLPVHSTAPALTECPDRPLLGSPAGTPVHLLGCPG